MNFVTIKRNFGRKLWSKAMVRTAVKKGKKLCPQFCPECLLKCPKTLIQTSIRSDGKRKERTPKAFRL